MNNVKATYVAAHFNTAAQANIPAYWTPAVGNRIWPCDTEAEAVELGEELMRSGVVSADVGAEA